MASWIYGCSPYAPTCLRPVLPQQPTSTSTTTRGGRSSQRELHCVVRVRGRSVALEHEVQPPTQLRPPPQPQSQCASKARRSSSYGRTGVCSNCHAKVRCSFTDYFAALSPPLHLSSQPGPCKPKVSIAQLSPESSRPNKITLTSLTGAVKHFGIRRVKRDGDCGFVATGISRPEFTEKLVRILLNDEEAISTFTPTQVATVRTLLTESALAEAGRLKLPPETYYVQPHYRATFEGVFREMTFREDNRQVFDDTSLVKFVTKVVHRDGVECVPYCASLSDLKLISVLFGVRIYIYEVFELEFDALTPENHLSYVVEDSVSGGREAHLICTDGNHFDRLVPLE